MSEINQRGLLVKFDEGVFARLDHETAQRRAANKTKVHRTEVVRSLLKFALDHCARARGETVPEAVEVSLGSNKQQARAGRAPAPVVEASSVVMTPERIVELNPYAPIAEVVSAVVLNCSEADSGPSAGVSGVEPAPSPAEALPLEPEPDPIEVGHVGGIGAIGAHVRTVGVRRA